VNSVKTSDSTQVEDLKDWLNETTQFTIKKMISTISSIKQIESNDCEENKRKCNFNSSMKLNHVSQNLQMDMNKNLKND